jgi:hypothetical protein
VISFGDLLSRTSYLMNQNSTGILTGIGVVGTISTAILTGRASFKAAEILQDKKFTVTTADPDAPPEIDVVEPSFREKLEQVWPQFIPPVGVGSVTIFCIIMANRLASKEAAAMAAAYSLSEQAFTQYKEKVVDRLGEGKERGIRDELAQDKLNEKPVNSREVIITGNGEVLCMDGLSGRYFESTMETIKQAENTINHELINHDYCSLSRFYEEIGLPPTDMSDLVGWTVNTRLELQFSTGMSSDKRPCIVISFLNPPFSDYGKRQY